MVVNILLNDKKSCDCKNSDSCEKGVINGEVRIPKTVEFDEKTSKVSLKDKKMKEFVNLCESLEKVISQLTREYGYMLSNEDYFKFKQEIMKHKNKTIIDAYNNELLKWKF